MLLGNAAGQHPDSAALERLARWIAEQTGATFGWLVDGGNAVGAQLVGAAPSETGATAAEMLGANAPLKACLLLNVEPSLDAADPPRALAALAGAEMVVAMTAFMPGDDVADVLLPIAPFTETSGTYVNAEGRVQSAHGVVKPRGDARPAWKVLRVLGNLLGLAGFSFETLRGGPRRGARRRRDDPGAAGRAARRGGAGRRAAVRPDAARSSASPTCRSTPSIRSSGARRRCSSPPMRGRRTSASRASLPPSAASSTARWCASRMGERSVVLPARVDPSLAANVIRVAAGASAHRRPRADVRHASRSRSSPRAQGGTAPRREATPT